MSLLRFSSNAPRVARWLGSLSMLTGSVLLAVTTPGAGTVSIPLTTGESGKIALGQFAGGALVRISVTGSGDLANSSFQTNPDGSVIGTVGAPWGAANVGAAYPSVSGFPSGDGVNRFPGGGFNYDFGGGSGWMFAGKQTTDTRDPAAIRAGAVVGTFSATPGRSDWFLIGNGGLFTVPAAGATLYVAVNESASADNHGSYTLNYAAVVGADAFASRASLGGVSLSFTGSNVGATREAGEPATHAGNAGGASVWWEWTAPKTGIVTLNTAGSSFDTLLAVYFGSALGVLSPIASDDNSGLSNTSRLSFAAVAGTAYQIVVDGFGGATGNFAFNLSLNAAVSPFAADLEGWGVVSFSNLSSNGFDVIGTYSATYNSTGGNPGGYSSTTDPDGGDFAFSAPAAFRGNRLSSYGASLTYDLIHPVGTVDYQGVDVVLVGNGTRLIWQRDPPIVPLAASWTTISVPLAPTAQWRVGTSIGALATAADFVSVLSNVTGLYIRGEYTLGSDLTGLDNVAMGISPLGAPLVNSLAPTAVSPGATVALTGANFTGATAVSFNGTAATSFTVVSDTTITAVAPSGVTAGIVTVTGPNGTSTTPTTYTIGGTLFTTQPTSQAVSVGTSATFAVGANGTTGLTYQWQRQASGATGFSNLTTGGGYAGATTASLTVNPVTALMNGDQFRCVVGDVAGPSVTSTAALLSVVSGSGVVGISIPLNSHDADSRPVLDRIWSVAVPPYPLSQAGIGVLVKPTFNPAVTSADWALHDHVYVSPNIPDPARAIVTLTFSAPTVVSQLEVIQHTNGVSRIECFVGDSLNSLVSIGSVFGPSGDVVGGSLFTEGAAQVFQFTNTTAARYCRFIIRKTTLDNGWAVYRVFPRDASGQRVLGVAAAASPAPVVGAVTPTSFGTGATVTVTGTGFTGATAVSFNGTAATSFNVVSDTSLTAVVPAGATSGLIRVTTPEGTAVGTTSYTITAPPVILASPAHSTVIFGGLLKLSVQVSGSAPFSYLWRFTPAAGGASVEIPGATGPTLSIANFASTNAGSYQVLVSNAYGTNVPSAAATVVGANPASVWRADSAYARPQFRQPVAPSRVTLAPGGSQFYVTWNNGGVLSGAGNQRLGPILRFNNDATGSLDSTFVSAASGLSDALAIAFQTGGQLLVSGVDSTEESDSGPRLYRVFRLNVDGTRDPAYRSPAFAGLPRFMTLQDDGKLLVACGPGVPLGNGINTLARLNADGSLDHSFTSPAFDSNGGGIFAPPVVDSTGRILIGGSFTAVNGANRPGLARLSSAGVLDASFVPAITLSGSSAQVRGLAIQTLGSNVGKILVAGGVFSVAGSDCVVVRLDPVSGAVDTSFNRPTASAAGMNPRPRLLTLDSATDGFTVVGATVARFSAEGVADTGFTRPTVAAPRNPEFFWMAATPDGRVLLPVSEFGATINGTPVSGVARLNATGALDTAFAPASAQREVFGDGLFVQSDSRALFFGEFNTVNTTSRAGLARFNLNGSLDSLALSGLSNLLWVDGGIVRSDGSFLVEAVTSASGGGTERAIRLFDATGALNSSVTLDAGVAAALINERDWSAVELLADDRMLVGVNSPQRIVNGSVYFVRVTANGALDTTFTGQGATNYGAVYRATGTNVISQVVVGEFVLLARYADGSALAAVSTGSYPQNATSLMVKVVRLTPSGALDTTFSGPTVSMATTSYTANSASAPLTDTVATPPASYTVVRPAHAPFQGAVILADGRVLVGGDFMSLGDHSTAQLGRLNANGSVDSSFSAGSGPAFRYRQGRKARITDVAVASDGKYWVTGAFDTFNGYAAPGIVRLNSNGSVDTTFATDVGYRSIGDDGSKIAFAADGSIYLAGSYALPGDTLPFALTRLVVPFVPEITAQLNASSSVIVGGAITLSVTATGGTATTYRWQLNGTPIPEATGSSLVISNATQVNAGTYRVDVSHPVLSTPLTSSTVLAVVERALLNLLSRLNVPASGSVGGSFTVEGGPKTIFIRAVGPSRDSAGTLADPRITLLNAAFAPINSNDDWGTNANASAITTATTTLGLSPGLTAGGKDAALLVTLNPGTYTVVVDGVGGTGGAVQLDIVDADTGVWPRLGMLNLRGFSTPAANLNLGFNIAGTAEQKYLIRTLGPTLGYNSAGNNGVLVDPYTYIYRGEIYIVENDDTDEDSELLGVITQVGAMPRFGRANNFSYYDNYDSTILLALRPGSYTARIRPYSSSQSGEVFFEVFPADDQHPAVIPPAFTYVGPNQNAIANGDFALGVVVVAKPAATFQWRRYVNGTPTPITGATANVLRLSNLQSSDSGSSFDVVVTSGTNTITSPQRTVTIVSTHHSADTNRDSQISLAEVTRVMQLHNFSVNGTRTGEYRTQADTEDGFAPGPGTRTSYHSADTDRDGRISGTELARVIELYSYANGTIRTGQYHPQVGTEDNFAPGPGSTPSNGTE